ncbi:hypothetical protein [Streptomyces sp. NPDC058335]|uniref:hypothetical protein n=1 Tax=Streptomyces sp. NPDC058335 TaxID=3346451 RepID=UPI0036463F28
MPWPFCSTADPAITRVPCLRGLEERDLHTQLAGTWRRSPARPGPTCSTPRTAQSTSDHHHYPNIWALTGR